MNLELETSSHFKSMNNMDEYRQGPCKGGTNVASAAVAWLPFFRKKENFGQRRHERPHPPRDSNEPNRIFTIGKRRVSEPNVILQKKNAAVANDVAAPRRHSSIPTYILPDIDEACNESSSVVSEMTNMTYSIERIETVTREFMHRVATIQQSKGRENLTLEEKQSVLRDVQAEYDWKMKRKKQMEREEEEQNELFISLQETRFHNQEDDNESLSSRSEETLSERRGSDTNCDHNGGDESIKNHHAHTGTEDDDVGRPSRVLDSFSLAHPKKYPTSSLQSTETYTKSSHPEDATRTRRDVKLSAASPLASSFHSTVTTKQRNAPDDGVSEVQCCLANRTSREELASSLRTDATQNIREKEDGGPQEQEDTRREIPREVQESEGPDLEMTSETATSESHIDEIIRLKILVAEQQATIDTQSANLHNLEVELAEHRRDRRRFSLPPDEDQPGPCPAEVLEDENRRLSNRLHRSRERETSWRMELDESNREQLELEGENFELTQENSKLRRMLRELRVEREYVGASCVVEYKRKNSNFTSKTEVTEASTVGTASVPNSVGKINCLDKSSETRQTEDTAASTIGESFRSTTSTP